MNYRGKIRLILESGWLDWVLYLHIQHLHWSYIYLCLRKPCMPFHKTLLHIWRMSLLFLLLCQDQPDISCAMKSASNQFLLHLIYFRLELAQKYSIFHQKGNQIPWLYLSILSSCKYWLRNRSRLFQKSTFQFLSIVTQSGSKYPVKDRKCLNILGQF